MESWPWFHIMDEATQGRLYNSNLVLNPEPGCAHTPHRGHIDQSQENNDILEFLIKTEMEDAVSAEAAEQAGVVHSEAPPSEGVPMGWRRMSECSYKSRQASPSGCLSSLAQFIFSIDNNFRYWFYAMNVDFFARAGIFRIFIPPN